MATRTVSQSGPISASSTFGGAAFSNGDDIVNPAGNNFTLTVDQNATIAGFSGTGGNGQTVVNSGIALTLTGNVIQGNKNFTFGSGTGNAHLVFDCTAADRKWLFGDIANYSAYADCMLIILGTNGARCTVTKTGSNACWFDCFSENSGGGSGKIGYNCNYCDFTGIGKADGSFSLAMNTFGEKDYKFDHCTFDGCAIVLKDRPFAWSGGSNKDFYIRDSRFKNATDATYGLRVQADGSSGSGAHEIVRNSFDKSVNFNAKVDLKNNFFGRAPNFTGGPLLSRQGNLYHVHNGDTEVLVNCNVTDEYWLAGLDHPGNPHCFVGAPTDTIHDGIVFEYSHTFAIDGAELVYSANGGITVIRCLSIPSETDDYAMGALCTHGLIPVGAGWIVEHNTVVGAATAQVIFSEDSSDTYEIYASVKSNLVVDLIGNTALVVQDIALADTDLFDPADGNYNGMFGQDSYADPTCGQTLQGYRSHFTTAPGANDIIANPEFVDPTRNASRWAVSKGAASSGDSLAVRTAALVNLLFDNPALIELELIPWVRDGFRPTDTVYRDAGHDGITIGALEGVWTTPSITSNLMLLGVG